MELPVYGQFPLEIASAFAIRLKQPLIGKHYILLTKEFNNVYLQQFERHKIDLLNFFAPRAAHSFEYEFLLQVHFHANYVHFYMKGFSRELVLIQRHMVGPNGL